MSALGWLLLIVAILWVIWYLTGGPSRAALQGEKPFMKPLEPVDSGEVYGLPEH
jgi:hypothetical protein